MPETLTIWPGLNELSPAMCFLLRLELEQPAKDVPRLSQSDFNPVVLEFTLACGARAAPGCKKSMMHSCNPDQLKQARPRQRYLPGCNQSGTVLLLAFGNISNGFICEPSCQSRKSVDRSKRRATDQKACYCRCLGTTQMRCPCDRGLHSRQCVLNAPPRETSGTSHRRCCLPGL